MILNGIKLHWDIVTIVTVAMVCVTIASFHGESAMLAAGAIGSIASTTMIQLMNLKRTGEVKENVAVVTEKLVENTVLTQESAKNAAVAVNTAVNTATNAANAIEKISDKLN